MYPNRNALDMNKQSVSPAEAEALAPVFEKLDTESNSTYLDAKALT